MGDVAKLGSDSNVSTATAGTQELFVINLCASMTPMPAVPKNLKGFEKYKLYQVSRQEDGRRRFRLRLGFFTSEADAEWVLNSVRGLYPAAFTGCVTAEDMRFTGDVIAATRPVAAAPAPVAASAVAPPVTAAKPITTVASSPSAVPAAPVRSAAPSAASTANIAKPANAAVTKPSNVTPIVATPAPAAPASKPVPAATSTIKATSVASDVVLSASTPAATPQPVADAKASSQPFHVGRGIDLPDMDFELTDEYATLSAPQKPALAPSPPQVRQPTAGAFSATGAFQAAAKSADGLMRSASLISPPKVVDDYIPILDTTLTIRTLTKTEAEDPNRAKWFAVQLALSEQPINLDTMPKLDIFAAYTLYSVATMESGSVKHALRLGFFRESVSAEAVMGYLKAFFNQPTINQISGAEFERFADSKLKTKPAATEGKVVNLEAKRPAAAAPAKPAAPTASQAAVAAKPAVKPAAVSKPRMTAPPARPQSFLSRLIGRQLD